MTLHLIGLGLNKKSISLEALEAVQGCDNVYLEYYTVNFPYTQEALAKELDVTITPLQREMVENESILTEAKHNDVGLLIYGDSLSATTHIQLISSCKQQKIPYKIYPNASIMTTIATTGLQLYKFGKTTSMPNWKEHTNKPTSYTEYLKENKSIKAHSLILTDIGLTLPEALHQLKASGINEEKLIILSHAGTEQQKIYYDTPEHLSTQDITMPYCIIIPGTMNFHEQETLELVREKS